MTLVSPARQHWETWSACNRFFSARRNPAVAEIDFVDLVAGISARLVERFAMLPLYDATVFLRPAKVMVNASCNSTSRPLLSRGPLGQDWTFFPGSGGRSSCRRLTP
jgi:hypothetical protein